MPIPPKRRKRKKSNKPPKSLRKAIDAKCKECIYDDSPGLGSWRKQVEECTINTCPMWNVRPRTVKTTREEAGDETPVEMASDGV